MHAMIQNMFFLNNTIVQTVFSIEINILKGN